MNNRKLGWFSVKQESKYMITNMYLYISISSYLYLLNSVRWLVYKSRTVVELFLQVWNIPSWKEEGNKIYIYRKCLKFTRFTNFSLLGFIINNSREQYLIYIVPKHCTEYFGDIAFMSHLPCHCGLFGDAAAFDSTHSPYSLN